MNSMYISIHGKAGKSYNIICVAQVCYARILDSKRKFLEAALRYYELSQLEKREIGGRRVDEDELQQALSAAITCTILAAAGPQRSRVLATLYKVINLFETYHVILLGMLPYYRELFFEQFYMCIGIWHEMFGLYRRAE